METAVNAALLGGTRGLGRPHPHRSKEAANPDPARPGRGLKSHRFPQAGVRATGPPRQQGRHTQVLCPCTASVCGHWLSAQDAAPGAARGDTDRGSGVLASPAGPGVSPGLRSQSHRPHGSTEAAAGAVSCRLCCPADRDMLPLRTGCATPVQVSAGHPELGPSRTHGGQREEPLGAQQAATRAHGWARGSEGPVGS